MNPEIKKLWTDALTSGEFKQGINGLLREEDRHCCLGVLCELHRRAFPGGEQWVLCGYSNVQCAGYGGEISFLPDNVAQWAELPENNPGVWIEDSDTCLSDLNDAGSSFAEIAKIIETQL